MSQQDSYAMLQENPKSTPKQIAPKITTEERILSQFNEAYKKVFMVYPTINQSGGFYHVHGYADGMSLKRLKQLTSNLKNRAIT